MLDYVKVYGLGLGLNFRVMLSLGLHTSARALLTDSPMCCSGACIVSLVLMSLIKIPFALTFYGRQHSLLCKPCTSHRRDVCPSVACWH